MDVCECEMLKKKKKKKNKRKIYCINERLWRKCHTPCEYVSLVSVFFVPFLSYACGVAFNKKSVFGLAVWHKRLPSNLSVYVAESHYLYAFGSLESWILIKTRIQYILSFWVSLFLCIFSSSFFFCWRPDFSSVLQILHIR